MSGSTGDVSFVTQESKMVNCSPVEDAVRSKVVMVILGVLASVFVIFLFSFFCVILKYRKMKTQYYDKLNLLKNRDPGRLSDEGSVVKDKNLRDNKKRQIIYKIGDDDGGNEE